MDPPGGLGKGSWDLVGKVVSKAITRTTLLTAPIPIPALKVVALLT